MCEQQRFFVEVDVLNDIEGVSDGLKCVSMLLAEGGDGIPGELLAELLRMLQGRLEDAAGRLTDLPLRA